MTSSYIRIRLPYYQWWHADENGKNASANGHPLAKYDDGYSGVLNYGGCHALQCHLAAKAKTLAFTLIRAITVKSDEVVNGNKVWLNRHDVGARQIWVLIAQSNVTLFKTGGRLGIRHCIWARGQLCGVSHVPWHDRSTILFKVIKDSLNKDIVLYKAKYTYFLDILKRWSMKCKHHNSKLLIINVK